jgi:hypothetical protein
LTHRTGDPPQARRVALDREGTAVGMTGRIALGAVVGVVVIGVVSANAGNEAAKSGAGKESSAGQHPESGSGSGHASGRKSADAGGTKAKADEKPTIGGDGSYEVGKDIKPGTYRTTGNTDGMCHWERAKDASGEKDSLIANGNVTGTSYVTVKATDKLFKSSGCKDWTKTS